jgi:nucleotide-binding universal stress UspA family protein
MQEVQQVLVAYDRSEMSHEALKRAISVAKKKEAQLIVVHVIEPLFVQSPFAKSVDEDAIKRDIIKQIEKRLMLSRLRQKRPKLTCLL